MTTPFENLQAIRGSLTEEGEKHETSRNDNIVNDQEFNINVGQLHEEFDKSLDISHQNHPKSNDQSCFSMEHQLSFETQENVKETNLSISKTDEIENEHKVCLGLDLELKLSLPGSSVSGNSSIPLKYSSSSIFLSPSSPSSCVSSNLDFDDQNLSGISNDELHPLVVMGCTRCHLFVMVPKSYPKCPKCENPNLLDVEDIVKKSKPSTN